MKKFFKYALLSAGILLTPVIWSCSDDDDDYYHHVETIAYDKLPEASKSFIEKFFPADQIVRIEKDIDDDVLVYEVNFNSGTEVTFSYAGEWVEVDAPSGKTIPEGIAPENIVSYLNTNYSGYGINDITKTGYGYEVELVTGLDLRFDPSGNFMGIDR